LPAAAAAAAAAAASCADVVGVLYTGNFALTEWIATQVWLRKLSISRLMLLASAAKAAATKLASVGIVFDGSIRSCRSHC
jgi:hypothetical protein